MRTLTHCTLTGIDEQTDLSVITALSRAYPFAEWGFLYSPKRQGQPGRYPSVEFLKDAFKELPDNVNVALHICGSGVPNLIEGEPVVTDLVQLVDQRFGRVQLNFNANTIKGKFTINQLKQYLIDYPHQHAIEFITQYNEANAIACKPLLALKNHCVLFDSSSGQGVSPEKWKKPIPGVVCGYAGGLGADNIVNELINIQLAALENPYWIDMEGKLRVNDLFNLDIACNVLDQVDCFIWRPQPMTKGNPASPAHP